MLKKLFLFLLFIQYTFIYAQFGANIVKLELAQNYDSLHAGMQLKVQLKVVMGDEWHINSVKPNEDFLIPTKLTLLNGNEFKLSDVQYPKAKEIKFSFSDKPVSVYENNAVITAFVDIPNSTKPGKYTLNFDFGFQACNNASCMPPNNIKSDINFNVVEKTVKINEKKVAEITLEEIKAANKGNETEIAEVPEEDSLANKLEKSGLFISLLIVFLGGLALNLTPCVYPLIPITVGYFGGQSEGKTSKLFVLGVLYVLGMALTYSIVGVITSLSGAVFGTLMQNPLVIITIALVLGALALSMFGVYEFKLPDSWVMKAGGAQSGMFGAFFMGLTMGIVAAPCIGPFVIGLVTVVGAKGDPVYGFLMFFFLAIGLGTPYLILALFSGKIKSLPRAGLWMEAVKHIFGFILVGMAIYFLLPILPEPLKTYLLPIFMLLSAIYIMFFDRSAKNVKGFALFKYIISMVIIVASVYFLIPSKAEKPDWKMYDEKAYQKSLENGEKIVIDFYADWCIPCKELDKLTFSEKNVLSEFKNFTLYKVDMTQTLSEKNEELRKKFNILGMPTVLLIDSKGKEIKRITGFVNAEEFLGYLQKVK
ncbi:MAG TPA: protein-disulfide reductase DsbD [Melioribacteraceae bacterium]|nr:protein-disulfide reductase DsbD [Melioribacteraceae bacterium]